MTEETTERGRGYNRDVLRSYTGKRGERSERWEEEEEARSSGRQRF
jgi:hypothetical protein